MTNGSTSRAGHRPSEPPVQEYRRKERDQWLRRRLLERQLHDGAALRISALTLRLGLLRQGALPDGRSVQDCIDELQDELHAVLEELRAVAGQIYPPLLDEAGLGPALQEVAERCARPFAVVASGERFGPAAEGAAYFAVAQCLAALPADAPTVDVVLRRENDELVLSVSGVEACHAELMDHQTWPLGGTVKVVSPAAGDRSGISTITARIPCE
ncbi:MAG: histidine kinase [Pseudonocardiaceae bacterium]